MPPEYNPFEDPSKEPDPDAGKVDVVEPAPAAPDNQAAIDAANKRAEEAEARAEANTARYEQKLEQVTQTLAGRYEQKVQAQDPAPKPVVTDADFDKGPAAVVDSVSRSAAKEEVASALEEVGQHYGKIIGNLTEQAFEGQMEGLRAERFHKYLEKDIRKFFEDNPQGKVSPQAARTIYSQYVGQRVEELLQRESEDEARNAEAQDDLTHRRVVRPNVRDEGSLRSPAPRGPRVAQSTGPQMSESEQKICDIYKQYGIFKDDDDWKNWKATLEGSARSDIPQDYTNTGRA